MPNDLRKTLGLREITRALPTSDRNVAVPMALSLAHQAKLHFLRLRQRMKKPNTTDEHLDLGYTLELRFNESGQTEFMKVEAEPHEQDAVNAVVREVLAVRKASPTAKEALATSTSEHNARKSGTPLLSVVVNSFLDEYQKSKKPAMFKKHQPVLRMFLEVVGDKPVGHLLQKDVNEFFALLHHLPPRWSDKCRQLKKTIRELAEIDHEVTLGPKSFYDTYIASLRPFLAAARKNFQDQGFPVNLTTEGIEYTGDREEGEHKQRAFKTTELKRLFEGPEMQQFAADPAQAHCFWLPHLGLLTGARVNEICQLNPQTDILKDPDSGVWYLWITTKTEGDPRIRKSVKTKEARKVPIHKKLISLGFLDYLAKIKASGEKLLFPQWAPVNRRASGEAEDWFRQLLRDTNLRDETPHACILGMHAFRHTLLTYGAMQKPIPLSLFCVTGHAQEEAPIHATGAGKGYLTLSLLSPLSDRSQLLDQLTYDLSFITPKKN